MARGERKGTRVVLKAYPRPAKGGYDIADALAANELSTHCDLQESEVRKPVFSPLFSVIFIYLLSSFHWFLSILWQLHHDL